ncbi:MAG TPA: iron-containing redox enzyme family protein [Candidatus Nitrosocosmicus sp.]|nr:iron-containing redox enzyme family protein [Candidatus Nitrosocosmicus sp.]
MRSINNVGKIIPNNLILTIKDINREIEQRSLLKHPFYKAWIEGKLTIDHLKGYSKEYFQLVKSIPQFVQNIYDNRSLDNIEEEYYNSKYLANIKQIQKEESEHVLEWINFALGLGVSKKELIEYEGTQIVNTAISNLKKLSYSKIVEAASMMYSLEKEIPKISTTKLDGLENYYGINNFKAIQYFKIHQSVDIEHTKVWQDILTDFNINFIKDEQGRKELVNSAILSLQSQNLILDSVYEKYVCN